MPEAEELILEWFKARICSCPRFEYQLDYSWELEFNKLETPPQCRKCEKWMDRLHQCWRCEQTFYAFFEHPRGPEVGIHLKIYRWECFLCLDTFHPFREIVKGRRIPPPALVVCPYTVKLEAPKLSDAAQQLFTEFDDLLDSI